MQTLPAGAYVVALHCPACDLLTSVWVTLGGRLTVTEDAAEMRVVLKQKGAPHTCGQPEIHAADQGDEGPGYDQPELDWAQRAAGEGRDRD